MSSEYEDAQRQLNVSRDDIMELAQHDPLVREHLMLLTHGGAFPEGWEQMLRCLVIALAQQKKHFMDMAIDLSRKIPPGPINFVAPAYETLGVPPWPEEADA